LSQIVGNATPPADWCPKVARSCAEEASVIGIFVTGTSGARSPLAACERTRRRSRGGELSQVLSEIVVDDTEQMAVRFAWLLDLAAEVGFVLVVKLMTDIDHDDPLNAVVAPDRALRKQLHLDEESA
jgi:hypothetical protein